MTPFQALVTYKISPYTCCNMHSKLVYLMNTMPKPFVLSCFCTAVNPTHVFYIWQILYHQPDFLLCRGVEISFPFLICLMGCLFLLNMLPFISLHLNVNTLNFRCCVRYLKIILIILIVICLYTFKIVAIIIFMISCSLEQKCVNTWLVV